MGASQWSYIVPYQENVLEAFKGLQVRLFLSNDYYALQTESELKKYLDNEFAKPPSEQFGGYYPGIESEIEHQRRLHEYLNTPTPNDVVGQLRRLQTIWLKFDFCGTHSAIDIVEPDSLASFTQDEIVSLFGTPHPTRKQCEQGKHLSGLTFGRFEARYLYIYENHQPVEICFIGISGD